LIAETGENLKAGRSMTKEKPCREPAMSPSPGNSVLRIHERKPCDPEGDATIIALKTPDLHGDL